MSTILRETNLPGGQKLQIAQGDLTEEPLDAIVNAANAHLLHGGGVAAAIARRGGPQIQAESSAWVEKHGPVNHAEPAYTTAGNLPCRYVIHAVGPVWGEGNEDQKLAAAVTGSLQLASRLELTSLAFPAISTGIFGFPIERAARVILLAIRDYCAGYPHDTVKLVRLTLFNEASIDAFLHVWTALEQDKQL